MIHEKNTFDFPSADVRILKSGYNVWTIHLCSIYMIYKWFTTKSHDTMVIYDDTSTRTTRKPWNHTIEAQAANEF